MQAEKPDVTLCIGQAGGRFGITPERVAINVDDARIPDNEGNQPVGTPIFEDGDTAYFSSLPIKAMVQKMREAGIQHGGDLCLQSPDVWCALSHRKGFFQYARRLCPCALPA